MPSLRHTVTLESLPRRWVEEMVASLHRLLEELHPENGILHLEGEPVPDVRHTAGRHLTPGARYEVVWNEDGDEAAGEAGARNREQSQAPPGVDFPQVGVEVVEWGRTGSTRLRLTASGPQSEAHGEVTLHGGYRPASLTAEGEFRGDGPLARYRRGAFKAGLDLTRWWASDGRSPAPLTVGIRHPLLRVLVQATVDRTRNGRWRITVLTTFHGRGWARPLVAVTCLFARARIRSGYRTGLDEMAGNWNKGVPQAVATSPGSLRDEAVAGLRARDQR
ncbi:hypothetical protein [Streptomyces taklimakanensis]|uniref:hypothetical protein n=1 Tax=Streptomyces taklimakanensis TaxID=2569853 RepID=UPI0013914FF6|nr:hypothetical protein [Streptomyces taklimakanensis]